MSWISIAKAAEVLDVDAKTIHRYRRKGVLRAGSAAWASGVMRADVAALRAAREPCETDRGVHTNALDLATFSAAKASIESVGSDIVKLRRMMGLPPPPRPLSEMEVVGLWRGASTIRESWSPLTEAWWVGALLSLRLKDLDYLASIAPEPHSWRVLLRQAATLAHASYDTSLRTDLGAARAHVERLARLWLEARGEGPRDVFALIAGSGADGRLLRRRRCEQRRSNLDIGGSGGGHAATDTAG